MKTLYRSRIEICRLLDGLAKNRSSLFMEFDNRTLESRMLLVDADSSHFVCAYGAGKHLNSKLFNEPSLKVTSHLEDADLVFEVSNPVETCFEGLPAIRFAVPSSMIRYHGRQQPRILISGDASLRCIADAEGILPFEAHIVDISHDGLGGIVFDREIGIKPGAVLNRCRIILPDGRAVVADLELRYLRTISLADGSGASRAGFRFIQKPDEVPELIGYFNQELE